MVTTQLIDTNNIEECNILCKIGFSYNDGGSYKIERRKSKLIINYEGKNHVLYKDIYYKLDKIVIYTPSIHKVDDTHHNLEILLYHDASLYKPVSNSKLIVSLFADVSDEGLKTDRFFKKIIDDMPRKSGKLNMASDFNLIDLLPDKKSFFIYDDNEEIVNIVFSDAVSVLDTYYNKLKNIILPTESEIVDNTIVYFNSNEEIEYIDDEKKVNMGKSLYVKCKRVPKTKSLELKPHKETIVHYTTSPKKPAVQLSNKTIKTYKTFLTIITLLLCVLIAMLMVKLINRKNYLDVVNKSMGSLHSMMAPYVNSVINFFSFKKSGLFKVNKDVVPV